MNIPIKKIPLQSIGLSTRWNLHPWALDKNLPPTLLNSLASTGILHPPLIIKTEGCNTEFVNVCGYRRLLFAKTVSPGVDKSIDCLVIPPEFAPDHFLNILIEDQHCSQSPLSLAEKARFLELASQFYTDSEIADLFLEKLDLKSKRSLLEDLKKLLSEEHIVIAGVHQGLIQQQMLTELLRVKTKKERLDLVELFQFLKLGAGKQRKFFQLIRDTAYKKNISITNLLKQDEILEILQHNQFNIPQKIHHLGNHLQQLSQPSFHKAARVFKQQVSALQLKHNESIDHSPCFEKDDIKLSIVFKNFDECKSYLKRSRNLLD